jgi:hypothetical protein
MTTQEIAEKLVAYCREGKYQECYQELYSPNCVSIEPKGSPMERAEGMEQIAEKGKMWNSMVEEFHGGTVGDPIIGGDHFCCNMSMDITYKGAPRSQSDQLCMYKVEDGKIVSEQFFYPSPNQ